MGYSGDDGNTWPYVPVDNLVDAFERGVDREVLPGRIDTIGDGDTTWRAFLEDHAAWFGVPVPTRRWRTAMFRRIRDELVHTVAHGDGATTIVGLAGVFGNVELWQQPFEILYQRHRTIAFDHFGTGETRVPPERVTFEEQVGLVADVLDSFEVERCLLAGDSSFAAVAVAAAHRWPERVDGLVLVGARIEHAPDERTKRFVAGLREAFTPTLEGFVTVCLPEDDHGHLRLWLTDIITRTGAERAAALVESFSGVDARPLLQALEVPVLVMHGALDHINPLRGAHEMAEQAQDAHLVVIDDAGHVPTLSRPEAVATAMDRFADRIAHH